MKVFVVLLSLSTVALASLEPAGYRPPGTSYAPSQYLPPHLQQQQQQQHHHHQHQSQSSSSSSSSPSSQYLPPSFNRPAAPPVSPPPSQYLPPSRPRPQHPQPSSIPSVNYLPVTEKPSAIPSLPPSQPSNDYLPPLPNRPLQQQQHHHQQSPSSDLYLPPLSSNIPANDYLPPSNRPSSLPVPPPSNDYLPPLPNRQPPSSPSILPVPPKTEYLPPLTRPSIPNAFIPPKNDYLPPSRQLPTTTPVPRISVVSVSPYKLDGPAYSKPQSKYGAPSASQLTTSATSSPVRTGGYAQSGYPAGASALGIKSIEQPADNYLPPVASIASEGYDSAQSGYRYGAAGGAAGRGGARVEQTTEPAKYDFEYRVSDEFGNDYAHKESREGAQTQGFYSVLLPDGRKQIVHYEADEDGFKPRISYEEAASVLGTKTPVGLASDAAAFGGYDKNANSLDVHQGPY